jgi:hypothetical protein
MLLKMINGILYMVSGKPLVDINTSINSGKKNGNSDDFDDYEEIE